MPKLYDYIIYNTDGSISAPAPRAEMDLDELNRKIGGKVGIMPEILYQNRVQGSADVFMLDLSEADNADPNPHFPEINGTVIVQKLHRFGSETRHDEA